jgi:hypothetical protein
MVEVANSEGAMEVFLVPAGKDRHELYCEVSAPVSTGDAAPNSLWGRLTDSFRRAVAEGEEARLGRRTEQPSSSVRRVITRKLAEAIAEQRLLWHLRHETAGRLLHPDDLTGEQALAIARTQFTGDLAKHRRWCAIDSLVTAVTGPLLFFVPGPNVVSWYFAFRAVGHFFSWRGAQQGQSGVDWTAVPSPLLTQLRVAVTLEPQQRVRRVDEIATALGLERLPHFIAGVADRPA